MPKIFNVVVAALASAGLAIELVKDAKTKDGEVQVELNDGGRVLYIGGHGMVKCPW